ncbi:MAG: hypothetical protein AB7F89_08460 [Pirellulaceae bacterium]
MSLFADDRFQWRETYFVLFRSPDRPQADAVASVLRQGAERYEVTNIQADATGKFEALTLFSPDDCSAMDVIFVSGDEVAEQVNELSGEIAKSTLTDETRKKLGRLQQCDARFDVYHFERIEGHPQDDEEFLDPGSLIIVLKRLTRLCHGVSVDPQSGTLM